jgi:hypothetical protein
MSEPRSTSDAQQHYNRHLWMQPESDRQILNESTYGLAQTTIKQGKSLSVLLQERNNS